ncbi:MAG: hypothetical protein D6731_25475 [Planctomycetota bacterium]|nr:MAG: hypothetical protein D6731_25475 [Planctomycetota bacterium]
MTDPFSLERYLVRRKVFTLVRSAFHVYDADMQEVLLYAQQTAFRLKEEFFVYRDESKSEALLRIKSRQILDLAATYDIADARSNEPLGAARRKALKSILRDEWEILDTSDQVVGTAREDSTALALVRRVVSNLVPQRYDLATTDGRPLGFFQQRFNPFVFQTELNFAEDEDGLLDRRLGLGLAVCMMAIEGRQK